ncbi:glycosyltransferase [Rhodobacterales bacterium HKCCE3408]|nr:glycosyltransferase [Rhodobacterales bacterium HKCCE3408]
MAPQPGGGDGTPAIAVIIPHYDDLARLRRCLAALTAQDLTGVEVVVADNATPGGLAGLAEAFPAIRLVTQPERGAAAARNKGAEVTAAPWLAFLDADCVPSEGWLNRVRVLAAGDPGTVTGGRIDVFDETPGPRTGTEAFETVFAFDQRGYIERKGFSVTANLVTARATFADVGPMIVGMSEDVDWCRRAVAKGYRLVYDDALAVAHPTRGDWPALRKKWRRMTEEGFGLEGQGAAGRAQWAAKAVLMPASILAHLPRVLGHPALSGREKWRGAGTLVRLRLQRMAWMLAQAAGRGI